MKKKSVFLIELKEGEKGMIDSIVGGRNVTQRLADLGLTPSTEIEVVSAAPFAGPIEIKVRDSKLVLGRGVAAKILVKIK